MSNSVLIIRFSALGDVAMLSPVVRQYAMKHPDYDVTVLSQPFCATLFDDIAPNVHFLGRDIKRDYQGVGGLYRLFRELHAMHFDRIVDCHDVLRTKVLRMFFKGHRYSISTIDKHRRLRKELTAMPPKKQLRQLPTSFENYWEALEPGNHSLSGNSSLSASSPLGVSAPRDTRGLEGSYGSGLESGLLFGIAPFAAHEGKIYPLDLMEQVVAQLSEKGTVILFGGKGHEEEVMRAWAEKYNKVSLARDVIAEANASADTTMSGLSGLAAELELMRRLTVMVSMDSANMHLASLVGTRVVSVWGATHPYAGFLGWGQKESDCVQVERPCRPCSIYGNKPCRYGNYPCLTDIKPEQIVKVCSINWL